MSERRVLTRDGAGTERDWIVDHLGQAAFAQLATGLAGISAAA